MFLVFIQKFRIFIPKLHIFNPNFPVFNPEISRQDGMYSSKIALVYCSKHFTETSVYQPKLRVFKPKFRVFRFVKKIIISETSMLIPVFHVLGHFLNKTKIEARKIRLSRAVNLGPTWCTLHSELKKLES
jgi:hypothetical protein